MQSKKSRIALLAVAALVAVGAFLVLNPGDGDESSPTTATESGTPAGGTSADRGTRNQSRKPARSKPEATKIEIEDGGVSGGVERIEAERGETIEFVVTLDAPDEIHVHGYELTKKVKPGRPARFRFTADLEGVYEVEAHEIGHVPVAELRVGG